MEVIRGEVSHGMECRRTDVVVVVWVGATKVVHCSKLVNLV